METDKPSGQRSCKLYFFFATITYEKSMTFLKKIWKKNYCYPSSFAIGIRRAQRQYSTSKSMVISLSKSTGCKKNFINPSHYLHFLGCQMMPPFYLMRWSGYRTGADRSGEKWMGGKDKRWLTKVVLEKWEAYAREESLFSNCKGLIKMNRRKKEHLESSEIYKGLLGLEHHNINYWGRERNRNDAN
jgi:hypothetical protein